MSSKRRLCFDVKGSMLAYRSTEEYLVKASPAILDRVYYFCRGGCSASHYAQLSRFLAGGS